MVRGESAKGINRNIADAGRKGKLGFLALVATVIAGAALNSGCAGLANTSNAAPAPQEAVQITPSSITFPAVSAGQQTTQIAKLVNTTSHLVNITQLSVSSPEFSTSGLNFPLNLGPGQSAGFYVSYHGSTAGTVSGTLSAMTSRGGDSTKVKLNGGGKNSSQLGLSSTNLRFGNVLVNGSSTQAVTLKNSGQTDLNISQIAVAGAGFSVSGVATPVTLPAGQSMALQTAFAPSAAGSASGSITITSDAANPAPAIALSGTGVAASYTMSLNPASISFGNVNAGSSASQTVTLSNSGNSSVTVTQVNAAGAGVSVSGFSAAVSLNPSQSIPLTVTYAPTAAGSTTGSITVTNNDGVSTVAAVTGTGVQGALSVSPASLSFGSVMTGNSSSQSIHLKNTGTASLTVSGAIASGAGFSASSSGFPVTLSPGQTAAMNVQFAPSASGASTGSLSIASSTPNSSSVALSGTGVTANYTMSLSPTSLSLGNVNVGSSTAQTVTLTNMGNSNVTISQVSATGAGISVSGLSAGTTIAPSQSVPLSVSFAPTAGGAVTGGISVTNNQGGSASAAVSGAGVVASTYTMSLSPSSVSFGNVNTGTTAAQTVALTNTGNSSVTISQVSASGTGISVSGLSAGATVAPSQSVPLSVTYSPNASGASSGSISVTNSQGGTATAAVTGAGVQAGISVAPSSAAFGNVTTGNANSQTIKISNTGTANLTISQAIVTGAGFSLNGLSLPLTIAPSQSSSFNVQFAPTAAGAASGSIAITSNASGTPFNVGLSGTGVAATYALSVSPASLSFGSVTDGTTASQSFSVTNTGNSNVSISGITASGTGYSILSGGSAVTLAPTQSASVSVQFAPSAAGSATGSVTIASNASLASVSLSGAGVAPVSHSVALSWAASNSTVTGYNVYRSTVSGSSYAKVNGSLLGGLTFSDSSVSAGQTYYYVATAVDGSGNESAYSNEVSSTIP